MTAVSINLEAPIVSSATVAVFIPAPNTNAKKLRPDAGAVVNVMVLAAIV